jgi:hypothetical protein
LASRPYRKQAKVAVMALDCASRPQRIIQPVAVEDGQQAKRLVVGLGFAEGFEDLLPAVMAWRMIADFVEGCRECLIVHFVTSLVLVGRMRQALTRRFSRAR